MRSFHLLSLLVLLAGSAEAGEAPRENAPRIPESRRPQVGQLLYRGQLKCTVTLLEHGTVITARHCFTHDHLTPENADPSEFSLVFPGTPVTVEPSEMRKLIFDDGDNDIAYLKFAPEATQGRITIPRIRLNAGETPAPRTAVRTTGFPAPDDWDGTGEVPRLTSQGCVIEARTGRLPPMDHDPGYEGLLQGMTCPAWFGNSGGPVYRMQGQGQNEVMEVLGVLTHTFDLTPQGDLIDGFIRHDRYGTYYRTSNYSSLNTAKSLVDALDDDSLIAAAPAKRREASTSSSAH